MLLVAGTVCATVLGIAVIVFFVEIFKPETDTAALARSITGVLNTLIGLLAGFLAGRTSNALNGRNGKNGNGAKPPPAGPPPGDGSFKGDSPGA